MTADVHALAGAYAVDALTGDELRFFERHLAACSACQREVAELRATAARLGAATAAPPPPHLRDRVLAAAATTRQLPRGDPVQRPGDRVKPTLFSGRLRPLLRVAAAIAGVIAVGASVLSIQLADQLADARGQLAELRPRADAADDLLVALGPDTQVVALHAPAGARAHLLSSPTEGRAVLVTDGFSPTDEGLAYQLWVLRDGEPVPDRTFQPDARGRAFVAMDQRVTGTDQVAVTVEPATGSQQPTGEIIAQGPVEA